MLWDDVTLVTLAACQTAWSSRFEISLQDPAISKRHRPEANMPTSFYQAQLHDAGI